MPLFPKLEVAQPSRHRQSFVLSDDRRSLATKLLVVRNIIKPPL